MIKINPCKKCGKEVVTDSKIHSKDDGLVVVNFYCSNCMTFRTAIAERKRDAIEAWNKENA